MEGRGPFALSGAPFDLSGAPFGFAAAPGLPPAALALLKPVLPEVVRGLVTPDLGLAAEGAGRDAFRASALSVA